MTIETLEDLLAITSTLTENEALRNVANCVMTLTEVTRYHNGKGRARTYNGDIDGDVMIDAYSVTALGDIVTQPLLVSL